MGLLYFHFIGELWLCSTTIVYIRADGHWSHWLIDYWSLPPFLLLLYFHFIRELWLCSTTIVYIRADGHWSHWLIDYWSLPTFLLLLYFPFIENCGCVPLQLYICVLTDIGLIDGSSTILPFYRFQTDDVTARLAKEHYFIDMFSPKLNLFCWRYQFNVRCIYRCTHILLVTLFRYNAYIDAIHNTPILMTLSS